MNTRPWRRLCANTECVEVQQAGTVWNVRTTWQPSAQITLSVDELGQLAQAYLDGDFGPVKVSRL